MHALCSSAPQDHVQHVPVHERGAAGEHRRRHAAQGRGTPRHLGAGCVRACTALLSTFPIACALSFQCIDANACSFLCISLLAAGTSAVACLSPHCTVCCCLLRYLQRFCWLVACLPCGALLPWTERSAVVGLRVLQPAPRWRRPRTCSRRRATSSSKWHAHACSPGFSSRLDLSSSVAPALGCPLLCLLR